jgi:hypothetical protein
MKLIFVKYKMDRNILLITSPAKSGRIGRRDISLTPSQITVLTGRTRRTPIGRRIRRKTRRVRNMQQAIDVLARKSRSPARRRKSRRSPARRRKSRRSLLQL